MALLDGVGGSVPPPGWAPVVPATPVELPTPVRRTSPAPDAAVRARLNAAIIDAVLIAVITGLITRWLGARVVSGDGIVLIFAGQFLYFFGFEQSVGQTPGKRAMHLHVHSVDGSRP